MGTEYSPAEWNCCLVLTAGGAKESLLPATPWTPVTSLTHTPVLTSVSSQSAAEPSKPVDVQDSSGDLHASLLRTITQLMHQQQQQPPQNQVTHNNISAAVEIKEKNCSITIFLVD